MPSSLSEAMHTFFEQCTEYSVDELKDYCREHCAPFTNNEFEYILNEICAHRKVVSR